MHYLPKWQISNKQSFQSLYILFKKFGLFFIYLYSLLYRFFFFFPSSRTWELGTTLLLQQVAAWEMEESSDSNKMNHYYFQASGRGLCSWKQAPHLSHILWERGCSRLQLKVSFKKKKKERKKLSRIFLAHKPHCPQEKGQLTIPLGRTLRHLDDWALEGKEALWIFKVDMFGYA